MRDAEPDRPDAAALRRVVLACAVLHGVDLEPYGDGVVVRGGRPVEVTWSALREAVAGAAIDGRLARCRVLARLTGARVVADVPIELLAERVRPVGLPTDHALHPGPGWARHRVLGEALHAGLGFVGVAADPDEVVLLPPQLLVAAGLDVSGAWARARDYAERMGAAAADHLARDPRTVLRPVGDCDVTTLLTAASYRAAIAAGDGTGMRAAAVPMRRRGWLDPSRIDPAFVVAAAAATDERERGFIRPLLVTADEVVLARDGGRPAELTLRDPAGPEPALPDVRWL